MCVSFFAYWLLTIWKIDKEKTEAWIVFSMINTQRRVSVNVISFFNNYDQYYSELCANKGSYSIFVCQPANIQILAHQNQHIIIRIRMMFRNICNGNIDHCFFIFLFTFRNFLFLVYYHCRIRMRMHPSQILILSESLSNPDFKRNLTVTLLTREYE